MKRLQPNFPAAKACQHCHNSGGESNTNRAQLPGVTTGSLSLCSLKSARTIWKNDGTEDEIIKHVQCTSESFLYSLSIAVLLL